MLSQNQIFASGTRDLADLPLAEAVDSASLISAGDALALAFLGLLAGCMALERRRPCLRGSLAAVKASYKFNLITFLLNDFTLSLLSLPALYLAAESFRGLGLLGGMEDGALKFLTCFLLLDLTMYAWHYAMHHNDGLWMFHRVHHDDACLNVTTGLRFHTGEMCLETLTRAAFIVGVGVDSGTVLACQGVISLFVLMHHANLRLPGEQWLSWIFIVPRLHRVHHSTLRAEHDSNYGAVFSFWDRLFGTLKELEPAAIGLPPNGARGFVAILRDGFTVPD